jgi:hypothetical protein
VTSGDDPDRPRRQEPDPFFRKHPEFSKLPREEVKKLARRLKEMQREAAGRDAAQNSGLSEAVRRALR